jgi:hypothetical protein
VCEECEGVWFGGEVAPLPEGDLTTYLESTDSTARSWNDLEDSSEQLVEPPSA